MSYLVPEAGSNPHDLNDHWILSPARLPIPPLRQNNNKIELANTWKKAVIGFEPTMKVLQTSALPLGYTAITLANPTGLAGFEPAHDRVKVCCLTTWL